MKRIIKLGMDVHSDSYTVCAIEPDLLNGPRELGTCKVAADPKNILDIVSNLKKSIPGDVEITCGYEAGCLGFSLHNALTKAGVNCVILAPSTMKTEKGGRRIKTDARDARMIAECMAYGGTQYVHIPTEKDLDVKKYLRMRDDHRDMLKRLKQQIGSFCLSEGQHYSKTKWTNIHLTWLRGLELSDLDREALDEYLATYEMLVTKMDELDKRIEELSRDSDYSENVDKLGCFLGVKTLTALRCITETGDFNRFATGGQYASYLGLVPGEHSSGDKQNRLGITKAGNCVVRTALVEAAEGICRGTIGAKSKALKARQSKCDAEIVAYADRANVRLRRKYYRMIRQGKERNVAVTAVARELACFIWGMMTGHMEERKRG